MFLVNLYSLYIPIRSHADYEWLDHKATNDIANNSCYALADNQRTVHYMHVPKALKTPIDESVVQYIGKVGRLRINDTQGYSKGTIQPP